MFTAALRTTGSRAILRSPCSISRSSSSSHLTTRISQAISHQRRNSSSKPSSSSNSDASQVAPVVKSSSLSDSEEPKDSTPGSRKRTFSKLGRTKLKESSSKTDITPAASPDITLPSVPPTQHLHSQVDIHIASLFAFHRPISITTPLPTPVTEKDFSQIFSATPAPKWQPSQVTFTLASAVQSIEKGTQQTYQHQRQPSSNPSDQSGIGAIVAHSLQAVTQPQASETQKTFVINLDEIAKSHRPFHPPDPPVPMLDVHSIQSTDHVLSTTMDLPAAVVDEILEKSPSELVPRQPFLNRLLIKYRRRNMAIRERREGFLYAISVKRQRRLKMKKHKYKKLMRRTRNLRQRLDRL